jgi:hypothetical protein
MMICPSTLAPEAFQLCVQHIHQSREPALYQNLLQAYEQLATSSDLSLPNMMDLAQLRNFPKNLGFGKDAVLACTKFDIPRP